MNEALGHGIGQSRGAKNANYCQGKKKKGRFMAYFFRQSQFCAEHKLNPHPNSIFFLLKLYTNVRESGVSIG